jgi:hypothetical protein
MEHGERLGLLEIWRLPKKAHRLSCGRRSESTCSRYVEKKTCGFAVQAARVADSPSTMGADFVQTGFIFESFTSSFSTLRCSCGWGRLVCVKAQFSHSVGRRRSAHINAPFTRRTFEGSPLLQPLWALKSCFQTFNTTRLCTGRTPILRK